MERVCAGAVLVVALGCSPPSRAPGHSATPTPSDTGAPTTGCFDVPIRVTGGFVHYGDPFVAAPTEGAVAPIVHGVQGSFWHLDTGLLVESVHPSVLARPWVTLVRTGQLISGVPDSTTSNASNLLLTATGECAGTTSALRAYLDDIDPDPAVFEGLEEHICPLEGEEVEIGWEVTDLTDGRTAETTLRAILVLDPVDVEPCSGA